MRNYFFLLLILFAILSCGNDYKEAEDIEKININFDVERFDMAFANAAPKDLQRLKKAYPFMFSENFKDSFWIAKMEDSIQRELLEQTTNRFQNLKPEKKDIEGLFKHLKYFFPDFKTPRVITTTSTVDYRNKIIVTDTIVLVSLDTYLGTDHYFYEGIQDFIKKDMKPEYLVVDLANKYAEEYIFQSDRRTLLDEFIYAGKKMYFKDKVIPFKTDAEKIGYTDAELDWAEKNEEYIWRYFVDRELLFSTDSKLPNRFINSAPFSKFYLEEIDNESPARIGQYIGWQIVKSYMDQNQEVTFQQMLNKSTEDIFNNTKFKPRK